MSDNSFESPIGPASAEEAEQRAKELEEAIAARPETQSYLVVVQIGGAGDAEIFRPGSRIELADDVARMHLAAGNIRALDDTDLPLPDVRAATQVIHEAEPEPEPAPKRKKAKSD